MIDESTDAFADEPDDGIRLVGIQVATLFRLNHAGRLLTVNEDPPRPAPRFFLGRTPCGVRWSGRSDLPDDLIADLAALVRREPAAVRLDGSPPVIADALRTALAANGPIAHEWHGPAYRFPTDLPPPGYPVIAITTATTDYLQGPFAPFQAELPHVQPVLAVIRDGLAVAVCHSARRSAWAAEAGVETLPQHRGQGYGAAVVTAWATAVRRTGLVPLYSTAWTNDASRALAHRLGLVIYADDWHLT